MKKRYRIGICLVLVVCLLFLSACEGKPDAAATDTSPSVNSPVQTTGSTPTQAASETTAAQPSENSTETSGTESSTVHKDNQNNLPETLSFNWKESYLRIQETNILHIINGKLYTFDELQNEVDQIMARVPYSVGAMDIDKVQNLPFTEAFFQKNSLLLVGFAGPMYPEITNVTYSDGVLTCTAKRAWDENLKGGVRNVVFYCFIEIDTVLPEGTEIVFECTDEYFSESELVQKIKIFNEKRL